MRCTKDCHGVGRKNGSKAELERFKSGCLTREAFWLLVPEMRTKGANTRLEGFYKSEEAKHGLAPTLPRRYTSRTGKFIKPQRNTNFSADPRASCPSTHTDLPRHPQTQQESMSPEL